MKIDNLPKFIEVKTENFPLKFHLNAKGIRYCFTYFDGLPSVGDPYNSYYDWINAISIYFTEDEFTKFRGDDSVHDYLLKLNEESEIEIKRLELYKLNKLPSHYCYKYEIPKINKKIEFLNNNNVILLKINFI